MLAISFMCAHSGVGSSVRRSTRMPARLPACQRSFSVPGKRMMSQPMGSSTGKKRPKLMRATDNTTRSTKAATRQVWDGYKQVGRPKSLKLWE